MLPQAEINAYHENGYLVVNNVLNDAEVQELRKVTDYFVDQSRAFSEHTMSSIWNQGILQPSPACAGSSLPCNSMKSTTRSCATPESWTS